ncbi:MAG: hypothetical protein ACM3YE_08225 [Bacteroidota bacterium]
MGIHKIDDLKSSDFDSLTNLEPVNSIRFYKKDPGYGNPTSGVLAVFYPKKPIVPDIMDLAPKVRHWVDTTDLTMGNWTSKEELIRGLEHFKFDKVPVYEDGIPIEGRLPGVEDLGALYTVMTYELH